MQDITSTSRIKEADFEGLLDFYILLQGQINEADKADQSDILMIPANIEEMASILPQREAMLWREERALVVPRGYGPAFSDFVDRRVRWASAQVHGLRRDLPKPIPPLGKSGFHGLKAQHKTTHAGKSAHVMAVRTEDDKIHFPPPKAWDPEFKWIQKCVMEKCDQKHAPPACELFKKLTPIERLELIRGRSICLLCFRHWITRECWSKGKVPNCSLLIAHRCRGNQSSDYHERG